MKRPGYREAIGWLVSNDDSYWLREPHFGMSVSATLVRDLFDVPDERLIADLRRALKRVNPTHQAVRDA